MSDHWVNRYVGREWRREPPRFVCWDAVREPLMAERGIEVAEYAEEYACARERGEIARLFGKTAESPWKPVTSGQEREFDLVLFKRLGVDDHIGLVVYPGTMFHVEHGGQSRVESYQSGRFRPRLAGFYRHESLA